MYAYLLKQAIDRVFSKLGKNVVDFAMVKKDDMAISTLASLESHIRSLCAMTCDVDEKIKEAEQCGQKKRKRQVAEWLEQVHIALKEFLELEKEIQGKGFVEKFFCGVGATKLDEKVHNLIEQHQHLGELVVNDYDNKGDILLTNHLVGAEFEKNLVGAEFEKNLQSILKFLGDDVTSIGIYGMGGVGKTTLAKHINNRLLEREKKSVFWTTVSQEYTITMLQDKIAEFIGVDLSTEPNEDIRAARLNKVLWERRNIIFIFDDVWEGIDMKMLGDPLSVDGCKLLITSRSKKVCEKIHCDKVIHLLTLKENEAWILFNDTLRMSLTGQVQEIAKSMVKLCDGLPLGIITIAGSMKGETDLDVWKDALNELRACVQPDMNERVFKVLKHSFDRLERFEVKNNGYSMTQHCFLYCSLYPEDYIIDKDDLIRRWIQEEFLGGRSPNLLFGRMHSTPSRKDLFSEGQAIMNRLIKACLLENLDKKGVKMHDLVRDMAHKITSGKYKVICGHSSLKELPNEQHWGDGLEKMSLMQNSISKIPSKMSPNCPKLSTLLLTGNPLRSIPISFFKLMRSLCILDLSETRIQGKIPFLSNMEGLKTLLLGGCSHLKTLPNLGKLKKLRELDLSGTAVVEVLDGVEIFYDLKFLSLDRCEKLKRLPEALQLRFPNLECLHLPTHIEAPLQDIGQLEHLEELTGAVTKVFQLNHLIRRGRSLTCMIELKSRLRNGMQVFKCYNPCDYLLNKRIEFSKYDFGSLEHGGGTLLAQDIHHLFLSNCKGLRSGLVDLTLFLNNPTSIEYLELDWCRDMDCIYMNGPFSNGDAMRSTSKMPPSPTHHGLFSHLSVLKIINCNKMKKLGTQASQLQNIQELEIAWCGKLEEIMEVSEDNGGGESQEVSVVSLPKLKILCLKALPSLKSLCSALIVCSSIEIITLVRCQGLKKLPLVFGHSNYDSPPSFLRKVYLKWDWHYEELNKREKDWWNNLEMGHDTKTIRPMLEHFVVESGLR